MEGRREDISLSFLLCVSQPREVDGLSQFWSLPGICYGAKVDTQRP